MVSLLLGIKKEGWFGEEWAPITKGFRGFDKLHKGLYNKML